MSVQDHNHYIYSVLARFHAGLALPEPPAFAKELEQLAFDYTPKAIARVDDLLQQIRRELHPKPDEFLAVSGNRTFLSLLAFMVGEAVARYRGAQARWFDYEGLQALMTERGIARTFPKSFATQLACEIEGEGLLFSLGAVANALLADSPESVLVNADSLMRRALNVPILSNTEKLGINIPENDPAWRLGVAIGNLTRLCIETHLSASGKVVQPPTLFQQQADGKAQIIDLSFFGDAAETFDAARKRLAHPEKGVFEQVFSYDGFIGLPEFRSDALILEATAPETNTTKSWWSIKKSSSSMRTLIALPYRAGGDGRWLALHDFRLLEFSGDAEARERLRAGLFSRMMATGHPGPFMPPGLAEKITDGLWQTYYVDENDEKYLASRRAALPLLPWDAEVAAELAAEKKAEESANAHVQALTDASAPGFDLAACQSALAAEIETEVRELERKLALGVFYMDKPLWNSVRCQPTLLREGRVVWGAVIQANNELFHPGTRNFPAEVVYSIDGKASPDVLRSVVRALFALRNQPTQVNASLKDFTDCLNAETVRIFGLPLPTSLAPLCDLSGEFPNKFPDSLRASTLWIVRKYLPNGILSQVLVPLLINDACPGYVMILPSAAWPKALLALWNGSQYCVTGSA